MIGIRLARYKRNAARERFAFWILSAVSLADALVTFLTLGYLSTDWRANLLFSDWLDRVSGNAQ